MNQNHKQKFLKITENLIQEGEILLGTKYTTGVIGAPAYVNLQSFSKWWGKVKSFNHQLGSASKPWEDILGEKNDGNTHSFTLLVQGTIEAIQHELENDYLETFTQTVKAETLADLLDQAEHLLEKGYFLAAGVLGRAVLEEHLRNLVAKHNCQPEKAKPTINDYNQALYKNDFFTKTRMKQVEALTSIGNDAAHNKDELSKDDVKKLILDLPSLIEQTNY